VELDRALRGSKELHLSTFRRDGSLSAPARIWFWYDGKVVYFTTQPDSFKAKRIRRGSPIAARVGGADGPYFEGDCTLVDDPELVAELGQGYSSKYWIAWLGLFRPRVSRVASGKTLLVRVEPRTGSATPPVKPG
jgi:hypothetical protein